MSEMDEFASSLLEEAKRFLERAELTDQAAARGAYLHAAVMLAFCSFEAHVNAIADDFAFRSEMTPHEQGILLEREVRLDEGEFVVTNSLRMIRLEDRINFLHRRFSGRPVDRSATWWAELGAAIKIRNALTHPKMPSDVNLNSTKRAILAIVEALNVTYKAVYKRKFPAYGHGLSSQLDF